MKIVEFNPRHHIPLWDTFLKGNPSASPYHSREWAKVLEMSFSFKERSLICLNQRDEIQGLLPLWEVNKKLAINAPWRDRAELITQDPIVRDLIIEELRIHPLEIVFKDWNYAQAPPHFSLIDYMIRSHLDLSLGESYLWKSINSGFGRNIRKAINSGVEVVQENSLKSMSNFYDLFKITRKKLGVPIFSWTFFENILNLMNPKHIRIYIGYYQSHAIAGAILLDSPYTAIYAYGASDFKFQHLRANDLLFWIMIKESINNGKNCFDFGSDSPHQTSLLQFKKKWGAIQSPSKTLCSSTIKEDLIKRDINSKRHNLTRAVLKKMPIWTLQALGKYLSTKNG